MEKAVSFYAKKLQEVDTTFPKHPKITNGSVRKCHSYILNTSNLPASVQQRSLGHHTSSSSSYWANNYLDPKDKQICSKVPNLLLHHFVSITHFSSNFSKLFYKQVAHTVAGHVGHGSDCPQNLKRQQSPPRTPPPQASGYHTAASSSSTKRPCIQSPHNSIPYRSSNIKLEPLNDTDEDFSMDLPRGARVQITLPGGLQMKFKIAK